MFRVHKGANAAFFLFFCNSMQGQCGLTRAFRPVNFDDPAFGQAADAEGDIKAQRTGRGGFDVAHRVFATEFHDRTLAELTFDLGQR